MREILNHKFPTFASLEYSVSSYVFRNQRYVEANSINFKGQPRGGRGFPEPFIHIGENGFRIGHIIDIRPVHSGQIGDSNLIVWYCRVVRSKRARIERNDSQKHRCNRLTLREYRHTQLMSWPLKGPIILIEWTNIFLCIGVELTGLPSERQEYAKRTDESY